MNGVSLGQAGKMVVMPLSFGDGLAGRLPDQRITRMEGQPPTVQHAIVGIASQEIDNIHQPRIQLARFPAVRSEALERVETRRGGQAESYVQPFINAQVNGMIREIQQVRPHFNYNTIRPTGQPYNQNDIIALNQTIAPIRADLLAKLPDLNPLLANNMSLGDLNDQVQYKTYLANGGKAAFAEWSTEKPSSPEKSALISDRNAIQHGKIGVGRNWQSADQAYNDIRASRIDVDAIAQNTGIKRDNIQKVKDHIFFNQHMLDRYVQHGIPAEYAKFDSDIKIAEAWKRLETGKYSQEDMQLIKHEVAERWVELKRRCGYCEAHDRASLRFPAPDWWR